MAAAKASVDMASAKRVTEAAFIWGSENTVGPEHNGMPPLPDLRRGDMPMVSPTEERMPAPQHEDAECVDADASRAEAGYSPRGSAV